MDNALKNMDLLGYYGADTEKTSTEALSEEVVSDLSEGAAMIKKMIEAHNRAIQKKSI